MCNGAECGYFRNYETSGYECVDFWSGTDPIPLPTAPLPFVGHAMGNEPLTNEAKAKFEQGIRNKWTKKHFGADCPEGQGCRCVETTELIQESKEEERPWTQPMTLHGGREVVVRGKYRFKFRDFKGICDENAEVGEPISWGDPEATRQQQQQAV